MVTAVVVMVVVAAVVVVVMVVVEGQKKMALVVRGERGFAVMGKLFYHQTTFMGASLGDRRKYKKRFTGARFYRPQ